MSRFIVRFVISLLVLAVVAGCGKDKSPSPTSPTESTSVTGLSISGCTQALGFQCTATATLSNGSTQNVSSQSQWSSSNTSVATISAAGVLNPLTSGPTTISASYGGKTGSATVNITINGQPPQQSQQYLLDGVVRETSPSASTAVVGARLTVMDGPDAGAATTSDGNGYFVFPALQPGNFTLRTTDGDHQTTDRAISLTKPTTITINMAPNPKTLDQTFTGSISGGDATTCSDGIFTKPCRHIALPIHNPGTITARLDWSGGSADLDLTLWRDGNLIASSRGVNSSENISSAAQQGSYELRVTYYSGSNVVQYNVRVTRPN